jgi:photosystem II stability/assembly factor-like uncharacterized protein
VDENGGGVSYEFYRDLALSIGNYYPTGVSFSENVYILWVESLQLYIAIDNSSKIITSLDGITWTQRATEIAVNITSLAWSESLELFVAVGNSGTVLTSPDGITWTQQTSGVSANILSVAWSESLGMFAATISASPNSVIITSPDGVTWTSKTLQTNMILSGKIFWSDARGMFIAQAIYNSTNRYNLTSTNGTTWTSTANSNIILKIIEKTDMGICIYLQTPSSGSYNLFYSTDNGVTFTGVLTSYTVRDVIWADEIGLFLAITSTGELCVSSDAINWMVRMEYGVSAPRLLWQKELRQVFIYRNSGLTIKSLPVPTAA